MITQFIHHADIHNLSKTFLTTSVGLFVGLGVTLVSTHPSSVNVKVVPTLKNGGSSPEPPAVGGVSSSPSAVAVVVASVVASVVV
mgnify:CR=1 FL=1